jgi:DNA-binding response OmpR family regulator
MTMRLLLVEDDVMLGSAVQKHLQSDGFSVDWIVSGKQFTEAVNCHVYDFVILDLGLPDVSGEVLLERLHSAQMNVRVIVATARGSVSDRVNLLNMGADDFLVKPFDLDELSARVRSLLRRFPILDTVTNATTHGALSLYPQRMVATWNGEEVALTHREFWVLETLVRRKNQVLTRRQIEEALYGWGEEMESNAIEVYVHMLRRKFQPELIHTIRGVGYKIAPV